MQSNKKDPYNFEKIDGFLKERKNAIGEMKQMYGKIHIKSYKNKEQNNEGRGE